MELHTMAEFTDKPPYVKQIAIYFQQGEYQKAYELSEEFVEKHPDSMASHFLLAKSAFWINEFEQARDESKKAFNLSNGEDEIAVSGILLACSHYRLKDYEKGIEILRLLKSKAGTGESIMKLKFVFALALHDEPAAMRHLDQLYDVNKKEASRIMLKLIEESK
jgi:tetratricopeptide (TPR) repeat protein